MVPGAPQQGPQGPRGTQQDHFRCAPSRGENTPSHGNVGATAWGRGAGVYLVPAVYSLLRYHCSSHLSLLTLWRRKLKFKVTASPPPPAPPSGHSAQRDAQRSVGHMRTVGARQAPAESARPLRAPDLTPSARSGRKGVFCHGTSVLMCFPTRNKGGGIPRRCV